MQVPLRREGNRWIATGPLPNEVAIKDTPEGQVFVSDQGEPQPECFGQCWAAVGPDSDACRQCDMEPMCRLEMAQVHLPALIDGLALKTEELTVEALAPEVGVNDEAVRVLLEDYRAGLELEPEPEPEPENAATKTKRPKRAPRRRVVAEASEAEAEGAPTENPTLAPAAQLVAVGASPSLTAKLSAKIATAWDAERRVWLRPWEAKIRRDKERKASPWIARLLPGMELRRKHAGRWWSLRVCRLGYQFQGIKYPTLQAATEALLLGVRHRRLTRVPDVSSPGKVAQWWCLPKLLLPIPRDRDKITHAAALEIERLRNVFSQDG